MRSAILLQMILLWGGICSYSQNREEIEAKIAMERDSLNAVQNRIYALQAQIDSMPGWDFGAFGTIGGNISEFTNWYAQEFPNNSSGNIGFTINGYANLKQKKFFWRNAINTNLSWVKLDNEDDPDDEKRFQVVTDVFNFTSLYGQKFNEKWAVSTLMEYRTTVLSNFHDPGYLDVGVGITWTPAASFIVVIQPLNYNIVLSRDENIFQSSEGIKIVADYTKDLGALSYKSNLSIFQSYKSNNLSSWTWINSLSYTFWKLIGIGLDFGFRNNRQEALNYAVNTLGNTTATFDGIDNDLQSYWTLGISYTF